MTIPHPRISTRAELVSLPLMFSLISARARGSADCKDVEQIEDLFETFDAALRLGKVEDLIALMVPDVVVLTSGLSAVRGTTALRPLLEQFFASGPDFLPANSFPAPDISRAGDMAFVAAEYQLTLSVPAIGERVFDRGRHAFVLQKHGAEWKIALLAGPSSPWFGEASGLPLARAGAKSGKRISAG